MESPVVITLMVLAAIAVVSGIVMLVRHYEKKRTEALQTSAINMGLDFSRLPNSELLPSLSNFPLFSHGHSRKAFNVMSGKIDKTEVKLFDYRYTTGAGKNQHTHNQTVVLLRSEVLDLPPFSLKPQHVFHNIGKAFGYQDIDFDSHALFSEKYLLRSSDEEAVREVFVAEILEYFEARLGLSTEARGDQLIFFRSSKKVKPEDLPTILKDGFHIFTLFKRST